MLADYDKTQTNDPDLLRSFLPGETLVGVFFEDGGFIHLLFKSGDSIKLWAYTSLDRPTVGYGKNKPEAVAKLLEDRIERFRGYLKELGSLEEIQRLLNYKLPPEAPAEAVSPPPTRHEMIKAET